MCLFLNFRRFTICMMKVVLVTSPFIQNGRPQPHVSVGLISVASVLFKAEIKIEIYDVNRQALFNGSDQPEAHAKNIAALDPSIVGFTTVCAFYHTTAEIARFCKQLMPCVPLVLGGPQASLTDRNSMATFPWIDVIVRGEAEKVILPLCLALYSEGTLADIGNITYRQNNHINRNDSLPLIKDLSELPFPQYELFPSVDLAKSISVEEGRGCPFNCAYCCTNQFWQRAFRVKPVEQIIALLKRLTELYGTEKPYVFVQDTPFLEKSRVEALCRGILESGLSIRWRCYSRIDRLSNEILDFMARAGCENIFLGIESGSVKIQNSINKRIPLDQVLPAARKISDHAITFTASFITGFPDETLDDIRKTIQLMLSMRYDMEGKPQEVQFHRLTPLMGSKLYQEFENSLEFDGSFWGAWTSFQKISEPGLAMIRLFPDLFSSFYYYPTPHISRNKVLKIHFLVSNVISMPYTAYLLHRNPEYRFLEIALDKIDKLVLPDAYEQNFGKYVSLKQVREYLVRIYPAGCSSALLLHAVMTYELIVSKMEENREAGILDTITQTFPLDIEGIMKKISDGNFMNIPSFDASESVNLVFWIDNDKVMRATISDALKSLFDYESTLQGSVA